MEKVAASISGGFSALRKDPRPGTDTFSDGVLSLSDHLKSVFDDNVGIHNGKEVGTGSCPNHDFNRELGRDVLFHLQNTEIYADRVILAARSRLFYKMFGDHTPDNNYGDIRLITSDGIQSHVHMPDWTSKTAFLYVLEFIYTGRVSDIHNDPTIRKLFDLLDLAIHDDSPLSTFLSDMAAILTNPYFNAFSNIRIGLEHDASVDSHSVLLVRSPFFRAVLDGPWNLSRDADGIPLVDLTHVIESLYLPIHSWMCTDTIVLPLPEDNFDMDAMLEYVVGVLGTADELMIQAVVDACGASLVDMMDVSNVVAMFEVGDTYHLASKLKTSCLDFSKLI